MASLETNSTELPVAATMVVAATEVLLVSTAAGRALDRPSQFGPNLVATDMQLRGLRSDIPEL